MNQKANPLPMEIIRESLELDPTSPSHLRWKTRPRCHFNSDGGWKIFNARDAGNSAGSVMTTGRGKKYWQVCIGSALYKAHRIVYALAYGTDPAKFQVDHRDGDGRNNNPSNLRLATQTENMHNCGAQRNNTSGRKCVTWHCRKQKWMAYIGIHGRQRYLGLFDNLDDAAAAYERAAAELHGEFARTA